MPNEADPTGNAPAATGMLTPQKPEGDFSASRLDAYHAQKLIERAIEKLPPNAKERKALTAAAAELVKEFGQQEEETAEFSLAEQKRIVASIIGPGQPPAPQQQTPPAGAQPGMQ
jgi:hypothetical protein